MTTDEDTARVLRTAVILYDLACSDPATSLAAFGLACAYVRHELAVTLRTSVTLVEHELQDQGVKLTVDKTRAV